MDPVNILKEETDADLLAQQAYAEQDAEEKGGAAPVKKPEEKPAEPSQEKPVEQKAEPSEEQEPSAEEKAAQEQADKEAKEAEEAENKRILDAKDDDLDDAQKAKKVELVAAKEKADKEAAEQKPEEEVIRDHALKHNLTIEEAKDDIDKTKAIIEKYKGDPKELARALRHTQSGYDQLKAKEGKPQIIIQQDPSAEIRAYAEANKEKIVANFRKKFPAKSEDMTDEVILEDSVAQAERDYEIWKREEGAKITANATTKRDQLLASIPEADKRFLPDVKALLSRTPDHEVVHESFDIKDLLYYARGSYYTPDRIKSLEAAAFKRGKEDPRILGVKPEGGTGGPAPQKSGQASSTIWAGTEEQKARALEMFSAEDGYTEERSYKAFQDTFKEELKKDKRFL